MLVQEVPVVPNIPAVKQAAFSSFQQPASQASPFPQRKTVSLQGVPGSRFRV